MTYQLVIQPEAEADLDEAYQWYEGKRPGLGLDFITSVEEVFERICRTPKLHTKVYGEVRQTLLKRFPYVVCYVFGDDRVDVVAVFHGHQNPTAWMLRVDGPKAEGEHDNQSLDQRRRSGRNQVEG